MASTVTILHPEPHTLSGVYKRTIKNAVHSQEGFEGCVVKLGKGESTLLDSKAYERYPNRVGMTEAIIARELGTLQTFDDDTLFLDIETDSAEERWNQPLHEFFRLGQYAWGEGDVTVTDDLDEVLDAIAKAETVIAHNGHNFDFGVLLGKRALPLTMDGKLFDTWTHATLVCPAPHRYTARNGYTYVDAAKPGNARRWFSLDNMAFQFGLDGKIEDDGLKALAKEFDGFGNIPTDDPRYRAYAETDVIVLREVARSLMAVPYDNDYAMRAQKAAAIDARMTQNGCLIDLPKTRARSAEQAKLAQETLDWLVQEYDFPTESKQPWKSNAGKAAIDALMESGGARVSEWPKTAKGARSYAGDALKAITEGTELEETGKRLAQIMGQRTLADQLLEYTYKDGRIHPDIDALQVSGRKCLPETHRILTRRGVLHIDDVVIGDETLDMRNRWVPIQEIHRYDNAPIHRFENRSVFLESTPEHKWVQWTENGGVRGLQPLVAGSRRRLQLTPDAYPFDRKETHFPQDMTDGERFAALVGLLVTDGTAKLRTDAPNNGVFRVYQTEGKFYDLFMELLPSEWITNDYKRSPKKHMLKSGRWVTGRSAIHEISLKASIIWPMLREAGLDVTLEGLRYSSSLMTWLLTLSQHETLAFLTAIYLADGNQCKSGGTEIASLNPNAVDVFQVAAYRCGKRSNYRVYEGEVVPRSGVIHLLNDRVSTRNLAEDGTTFVEYEAPVWCVTTSTGTFTAWYPEGRFSGPYLTGNSSTKPGVTTFGTRAETIEKSFVIADKGMVMVEADLSNADQRAVAFMSKDKNYAKRFIPGADGHEISGRLMFGDKEYESQMPEGWEDNPHLAKENPLRHVAKALSHAYAYGAGTKKLSATSGQPLELAELFVNAMETAYPQMIAWQHSVRRDGEKGWVTNHWGRRMPCDPDRAYTMAPALAGQSSTTEMLTDTFLKLYEVAPEVMDWLCFTVHDAVLVQLPEDKVDYYIEIIKSCADQTINGIEIFMEAGTPARNWRDAAH